MWALVGNNVAVLGAFLHCNLEDINSPCRADAQHPKIFSGILVSPFLVHPLSHLRKRRHSTLKYAPTLST